MRLDKLPTSDRVEDRRGLPVGPASIGIGTVVVLALIGWALGIDPNTLIGGAEQMLPGGSQIQQQVPAGAPSDEMGHFVSAVGELRHVSVSGALISTARRAAHDPELRQ